MHVTSFALVALGAASAVLATPTPEISSVAPAEPTGGMEQLKELAQSALEQAKELVEGSGLDKRAGSCTWQNIKIRREWQVTGALTKAEKKAYISAVKCIQSKPPKTPQSAAPGARTRFDDFVATHINQTQTIHYTGNFLVWHRYFTWLYEEALQKECGYKGTQPYWDWAQTAATGLHKSPVFDGSDTSMSGDGEFIPDQPDIVLGASSGLPPVYLPAGSGGGCVLSGPFRDMMVNLGPAALDKAGGEIEAAANPLAHNPRCLKRDLGDAVNRRYANATSVLSNLLRPQTVFDFQMQMQGVPGTGDIGIHGGGHYTLGGDPGRDVFTSPGDPVFYLHHSMIDRVWWIWQMLNPGERIDGSTALMGTNTFLDTPPSKNTTLDDFVGYGYAAAPARRIRELMSTVAGPFCYVYL